VLVQAQVGDQLFQLPVLVLELLHPPQLADTQPAVHLLPAIERLLGNPDPAVTSATGVPVSACFNANAICSSAYLDLFMFQLLARRLKRAEKLSLNMDERTGRASTTTHLRLLTAAEFVHGIAVAAQPIRGGRLGEPWRIRASFM